MKINYKLFQISKSYKSLNKVNKLNYLTNLRSKIEINFQDIKRDYFYNLFVKDIEFNDFNQLYKNHTLFKVIDYNFNKEILLKKYKKHKYNHPVPEDIARILKTEGFNISPLLGFYWKLFVCKIALKSFIKIIFSLRVTKKKNLSNFIYLHNTQLLNISSYKLNEDKFDNKFSWFSNYFKKISFCLPNLKKENSQIFSFENWNFFEINSISSLLKVLFNILIKFFLSIILLFLNKWHYAFLYEEIIKCDFIRHNENQDYLPEIFLFDNEYYLVRPFWTITRYIQNKRVILYFSTANYDFIDYGFENTEPYLGYKSLSWPEYIVWDERQKNILKKFSNKCNNQNIKIGGPIPNLYENILFNFKQNKRYIALFDVQPYRRVRNNIMGMPNDYYTFEIIKKFYLDIISLIDKNFNIVLKRKRFSKDIDRSYINFIDKLTKSENIFEVDPSINPFKIITDENIVKSICVPFTGPCYIAKKFEKKSLFYDPTGKIINNYNDQIKIAKTKEELNNFIYEKI